MENLFVIAGAFVTAIILGRIIIPNILLVSFRKRLFAPHGDKGSSSFPDRSV